MGTDNESVKDTISSTTIQTATKRPREEQCETSTPIVPTLQRQQAVRYVHGTNAPATSVHSSAVTTFPRPILADMSVVADPVSNDDITQEEWEDILGPILGELEVAGEHMRTVYPIPDVQGHRLRVTGIKWVLEQENPKKKGWYTTKSYCHTDLMAKPTRIRSFYVPNKDSAKGRFK